MEGCDRPLKFQYSSYSHVGARENNEDSLGLREFGDSLAAIVADGVGGSANGEAASALAVEQITAALAGSPLDEDTLLDAIVHASDAITHSPLQGYTTAVVLWLQEEEAVAANVGDSRIYQFRDGEILYQSTDHSDVQMAVLLGELPPEAMRTHPSRNRIFRALGMPDDSPKVDSQLLTVAPGDRFLLCSDGFWEPVLEEAMLATLSQTQTADQWLTAMRDIVFAAADPLQDNHTAIAIIAE